MRVQFWGHMLCTILQIVWKDRERWKGSKILTFTLGSKKEFRDNFFCVLSLFLPGKPIIYNIIISKQKKENKQNKVAITLQHLIYLLYIQILIYGYMKFSTDLVDNFSCSLDFLVLIISLSFPCHLSKKFFGWLYSEHLSRDWGVLIHIHKTVLTSYNFVGQIKYVIPQI